VPGNSRESLRISYECSQFSFVGMVVAELPAIVNNKVEKIMYFAVRPSEIGIGNLLQTKKRSDVRVRHCPFCRKPEQLPGPRIARSVKSADVAVSGSGNSSIRSLSATKTEFYQPLTLAGSQSENGQHWSP